MVKDNPYMFFFANDEKKLFAKVQTHIGDADASFILKHEDARGAIVVCHPNGLTYILLLNDVGEILMADAWAFA